MPLQNRLTGQSVVHFLVLKGTDDTTPVLVVQCDIGKKDEKAMKDNPVSKNRKC